MLSLLVAGLWALERLVKAVKNGAPVEGEHRDTIEPEGVFLFFFPPPKPATLV